MSTGAHHAGFSEQILPVKSRSLRTWGCEFQHPGMLLPFLKFSAAVWILSENWLSIGCARLRPRLWAAPRVVTSCYCCYRGTLWLTPAPLAGLSAEPAGYCSGSAAWLFSCCLCSCNILEFYGADRAVGHYLISSASWLWCIIGGKSNFQLRPSRSSRGYGREQGRFN